MRSFNSRFASDMNNSDGNQGRSRWQSAEIRLYCTTRLLPVAMQIRGRQPPAGRRFLHAYIEIGDRSAHAEDRACHRSRVAAWPASAFDLVEELGTGEIEERRFLEVDRVPGIREYDQCCGRDRALHQEARFEARVILVASHDQGRHFEAAHAISQIPQ